MASIKSAIKLALPPIFFRLLTRYRESPQEIIMWNGRYNSYEEALTNSEGYNSPAIFEKVITGVRKVKAGEAAFERDSVVFETMQYNWPLLASLLRLATRNDGKLHIVDFGGSLGSTYFQCRNFLSGIKNLQWSVVEQKHFIDFAAEFESEQLKFYYSIQDAQSRQAIDVILFSSVLQYLPDPVKLIQQVKACEIPFIILDRTAFAEGTREMWTVQSVHEPIYEASYPAYFFTESGLIKRFEPEYQKAYEFENGITGRRLVEGIQCKWTGLVLEQALV